MTHHRFTILLAIGLAGASVGLARADSAPAAHGDAAAGERVFTKCKSCHQIGEGAKSFSGPELNGIIGRPAASVAAYNYSPALKGAGLTWDEANFREFVKNPHQKVPGTKMAFAGLSREQDVDDLIAYVKQFAADGKKQ